MVNKKLCFIICLVVLLSLVFTVTACKYTTDDYQITVHPANGSADFVWDRTIDFPELSNEGYELSGLYLDSELTQSVTVEQLTQMELTGNVEIYVKWDKKQTPIYTVTVHPLNDGEDVVWQVGQEAPTFKKVGYVVDGFYIDENCSTAIELSSDLVLTSDIEVWVKWVECSHSGRWITDKNSTCTTEGSKHRTCTICDKYMEDTIPALGHNMYYYSSVEPTCTESGSLEYWFCSYCSKYYSDEKGENELHDLTIQAKGHTYGEWISEVPATCVSVGTKGHYCCSDCNKYFDADHNSLVDLSILPHGHTLTHHEEVKATCVEGGYKEYWSCSECNKNYADVNGTKVLNSIEIAPLGHSYDQYISREEPTCSEEGILPHFHCEACDKNFDIDGNEMDNVSIPVDPTKHNYDDCQDYIAPTCCTKGSKEYFHCADCDKYFDIDEKLIEGGIEIDIDPTAHVYDIVDGVSSTCTVNGTIDHITCTACGTNFNADLEVITDISAPLDPDNHNYDVYQEYVAPTCCTKGTKEYFHCADCDKYFDVNEQLIEGGVEIAIDPTAHDPEYEVEYKAPTCTEVGSYEHFHCELCGKNYSWDDLENELTETVIDKLAHSMTHHANVDATCTEDGNVEYWSCSSCGLNYADEEGTVVLNSVVIKSEGHNYDDYQEETPATCLSDGCKAYIHCNVCDSYFDPQTKEVIDNLVIEKIAHNMTHHEKIEPTCTDKGTKEYYNCSECGIDYADENGIIVLTSLIIDAKGHDMTHHERIEPTCTDEGVVEYWSCSNCNKNFADFRGKTELDDLSIEAKGHNYGEWIERVDSTCTIEGELGHYHCDVCNVNFDINKEILDDLVISAKGHNYEGSTVTYIWNESNRYICTAVRECTRACGENGHTDTAVNTGTWCEYIYASCTVVPEMKITFLFDETWASDYTTAWFVIGEKEEHNMTYYKEVPATCTEDGTVEYWSCSACQINYADEKGENALTDLVIKAKGHSYEEVVTAPTCTEKGYTTHTCSVCKDSYEDSYIDAKGHSYNAVVTAPTCTEKGYTTHTCSACRDSYVDSYVDANGHISSDWIVDIDATCIEEGSKHKECTVCGTVLENGAIEATGHTEEKIEGYNSTCTKLGLTDGVKCSVCGEILVEQKEITLKAHTYDDEHDNECNICGYVRTCSHLSTETVKGYDATCTESGLTDGQKCLDCGETLISQEVIKAKGHNYSTVVTDPTCTAQGFTTYTCTACGHTYKGNYVDANGHSYGDWYVVIKATCTANGEKRHDCSNCNHYETEPIEATGHSYKTVVTAPTCTEQGYTTHTCSACGDSYVDSYVKEIGHDYGSWTSNGDGTHTRICANDSNHTETVSCSGGEATCTDKAKCEVCGDEYGSALGHSYGKWIDEIEETCTSTGTKGHYYCSVCEKNFDVSDNLLQDLTIEINPDAHKFGSWISEVPATCTVEGVRAHKDCEYCGEHFDDKDSVIDITILAKGHDFENAIVSYVWNEKDPYDCTAVRECTRGCNEDGHTETSQKSGYQCEYIYATCTVIPKCKCTFLFKDSWASNYTTEWFVIGDALGHDYEGAEVTYDWIYDDGVIVGCTATRECTRNCGEDNHAQVVQASSRSYEWNSATCCQYEQQRCTVTFDVDWAEEQVSDWYVTGNTYGPHKGARDENLTYEVTIVEGIVKVTAKTICMLCGDEMSAEASAVTATGESTNATCYSPAEVEYRAKFDVDWAGSFEAGEMVEYVWVETSPKLEHKEGSAYSKPDNWDDSTATCTEAGVVEHWTCPYCECYFDKDNKEIAEEDLAQSALGHLMVYYKKVDETCTSEGREAYYHCTRCEHYFLDEKAEYDITEDLSILVIMKADHDMTIVYPAVPPTCSSTGHVEYYYCEKCDKNYDLEGTELSDDDIVLSIVPDNHDYDTVDITPATCCETGIKAHIKCTLCGKLFNEDFEEVTREDLVLDIDFNAHDPDSECEYTAPTCTSEGELEHFHCSLCDKNYSWDDFEHELTKTSIDKLSHSMTYHAEVPATCTADGNVEYWACSSCGFDYADEQGNTKLDSTVIGALGHSYGEWITEKPASCTATGVKGHYTCSICESNFGEKYDVLDSLIIDKLSHSMTHHGEVPATCTDDGNVEHWACSSCGFNYADEQGNTKLDSIVIGALGHSYVWTDNGDGTHTGVCGNDATHTVTESHTFGDSHFCVCGKEQSKLYLVVSNNWKVDDAWFAAYYFNNSTNKNEWVQLTSSSGSSSIYECYLLDYPNVIFIRMNPKSSNLDWNNKWNQTGDLDVLADEYYVITDWTSAISSTAKFWVRGSESLTVSGWGDPIDANLMTFDKQTGLWTLHYNNVASGSYEFKVTDESGVWYGDSSGNNASITVSDNYSRVTITFTPASGVAVSFTSYQASYTITRGETVGDAVNITNGTFKADLQLGDIVTITDNFGFINYISSAITREGEYTFTVNPSATDETGKVAVTQPDYVLTFMAGTTPVTANDDGNYVPTLTIGDVITLADNEGNTYSELYTAHVNGDYTFTVDTENKTLNCTVYPGSTIDNPLSIAEAQKAANALESGDYSSYTYYITGYVVELGTSDDYTKGAKISQTVDSGDSIITYFVYWNTSVKLQEFHLGDEVTILSYLQNYNGTPEITSKSSTDSTSIILSIAHSDACYCNVAKDTFDLGYSSVNTVGTDLPGKFKVADNDISIDWTCNPSNYLSNYTLILPESGRVKVTLTATFTLGEATATQSYEVVLSENGLADRKIGYYLINDVNELKVGDQIIIVAKDYEKAMGTSGTNNRTAVGVTKNGSTLTFSSDVQIITLQSGTKDGTFAFYTGSGYLYAASSSKNYLKTETSLSDNSSWSISFETDGTATITAQGKNTNNWLQYNSSSDMFSCYKSAQKDIVIYKCVTMLDAPVVTVDQSSGVASWNPVLDATGYMYSVDDGENWLGTSDTQVTIDPGQTIIVKAYSSGEFADSDASVAQEYIDLNNLEPIGTIDPDDSTKYVIAKEIESLTLDERIIWSLVDSDGNEKTYDVVTLSGNTLTFTHGDNDVEVYIKASLGGSTSRIFTVTVNKGFTSADKLALIDTIGEEASGSIYETFGIIYAEVNTWEITIGGKTLANADYDWANDILWSVESGTATISNGVVTFTHTSESQTVQIRAKLNDATRDFHVNVKAKLSAEKATLNALPLIGVEQDVDSGLIYSNVTSWELDSTSGVSWSICNSSGDETTYDGVVSLSGNTLTFTHGDIQQIIYVKATLGTEKRIFEVAIEPSSWKYRVVISEYATQNELSNAAVLYSISEGNIIIKATDGSLTPKYYTSDTTWRIYTGAELSVESTEGYIIKTVTIYCSGSLNYNGNAYTSGSDIDYVDGKTWVAGGTVKITEIVVEYTRSLPDAQKLDTITLAPEVTDDFDLPSVIQGSTVTWSVPDGTTAIIIDGNTAKVTTGADDTTVTLTATLGDATKTFTVTVKGHTHTLTHVGANASTCVVQGNIEYYECSDCGKKFSDSEGSNQITTDVTLPLSTTHTEGTSVSAKAPTCNEEGNYAYYICSVCGKYIITKDEGPIVSEDVKDTVIEKSEHVDSDNDGTCDNCGEAVSDQGGSTETNTLLATFDLGDNGSKSHSDGSSATSYTETNGDYTLTLSSMTKVYTGAIDAEGNGALKLGTSSAAGSFSFTVDDSVKKVKIYVAGYKAKTCSVTVNDQITAIPTKSNDGDYTVIEVDVSTSKTVTFAVSTNYRCMIDKIEFYSE